MRFLLTPLREGRPFISQSVTALLGAFLLTPLREGRQLLAAYSSYVSNFYSRPCGRGDASVASTAAQPFSISTHAPAGGATIVFLDGHLAGRDISTHAPAGGATTPIDAGISRVFRFLLTPLREGRLCADEQAVRIGHISTHAPAGGATRFRCSMRPARNNFYSRPCGRGDDGTEDHQILMKLFLLTPLREGRQQFSTSPS